MDGNLYIYPHLPLDVPYQQCAINAKFIHQPT